MFDSTFIWKLPKWHAIPSLLQNRLKEWKWLKEREGEEEKEWLNVSTWLVIWPNYLCLVAQSLACSIATHYACQLSAVHECTMLSLCVCVCDSAEPHWQKRHRTPSPPPHSLFFHYLMCLSRLRESQRPGPPAPSPLPPQTMHLHVINAGRKSFINIWYLHLLMCTYKIFITRFSAWNIITFDACDYWSGPRFPKAQLCR